MNEAAGSSPGRAATISRFNDEFRRSGQGGRVMLTAGVAALQASHVAAISRAVAIVAALQSRDGETAAREIRAHIFKVESAFYVQSPPGRAGRSAPSGGRDEGA